MRWGRLFLRKRGSKLSLLRVVSRSSGVMRKELLSGLRLFA